MTIARLFAATVLGASLLAAGPALSDPKGCPPGLAKKGWCSQQHNGRDRHDDRDRYSRHDHDRYDRDRYDRDRYDRRDRDWDRHDDWSYDRGDRYDARDAYEQGYRDAMHDAWRVGDRLPRDRYRVVPDYTQYGWPAPLDGRSYVYADDQYYMIEQATGLVLDILTR